MHEVPEFSVSVVIPIHNSLQFLEPCLEALKQSSLAPLECIVVDDGSTDGSPALAAEYGARVIPAGARFGPARARNLGANEALGDLILFLDSDVCVHPDTLQRIVARFLADETLDALMGAYDESPAAPSFVSQYRNLLHCFTHRQARTDASTFWCGCGAVRRDVFLHHGGLDETFDRPAIEDIEFGTRLTANGRSILMDATIQVKHLKRWTFWQMLRTDVMDRGIPWSLLILRLRWIPDDLNVRWSQRISVALTGLLILFALAGQGLLAGACILALIIANAPFYGFLASRRGSFFALKAVPMHILFHACCGIAFTSALVIHFFRTPDEARELRLDFDRAPKKKALSHRSGD